MSHLFYFKTEDGSMSVPSEAVQTIEGKKKVRGQDHSTVTALMAGPEQGSIGNLINPPKELKTWDSTENAEVLTDRLNARK